jgi:AcrR family transcriptional regulator
MPRADAERNRKALVAAARQVFERDGYVAARITDIAEAAGVAHGSFYSHFPGKQDVLAAVLAEVAEEMLHPVPLMGPALAPPEPGPEPDSEPGREPDPVAAIAAANLAYLTAYQRNARLMALLEQVAAVDEKFRAIRLRRTEAFLARNARAIRRLQQAGLADPALDPDLAALALSTMVSRSAYAAFALGATRPVDVGELAATLTRLWVSGLRLPG